MLLHLAAVTAARPAIRVFTPAIIFFFKIGIRQGLNWFRPLLSHLYFVHILHPVAEDVIQGHQGLFMAAPEGDWCRWRNERNNVRNWQLNGDKIFFPLPITMFAE